MREILFRGKAINRVEGREYRTNYKNGDWVYGLVTNHHVHPILPAEMRNEDGISDIEVDYETIGQYTGLKDKNGKKVFEGDIIQVELGGKPGSRPVPIYFGEYIDAESDYDDYRCIGFYIKTPDGCCNIGALLTGGFVCEVIGTIFDNPELLEGKNEI